MMGPMPIRKLVGYVLLFACVVLAGIAFAYREGEPAYEYVGWIEVRRKSDHQVVYESPPVVDVKTPFTTGTAVAGTASLLCGVAGVATLVWRRSRPSA
jgi:hypothetical protein